MARLVIPAGAQPDGQAYEHRPETWAQLAAEARVELANLGDAWCIANHVDGLGIADDYVEPPPPPVVDPDAIDPSAALALVRMIDQSGADTVADLRAAAAEAAGVT